MRSLIIGLCLLVSACSSSSEIGGQVTAQSGAAVGGAHVIVFYGGVEPGLVSVVQTSSTGAFSVFVKHKEPGEKAVIVVSASGYAVFSQEVDLLGPDAVLNH